MHLKANRHFRIVFTFLKAIVTRASVITYGRQPVTRKRGHRTEQQPADGVGATYLQQSETQLSIKRSSIYWIPSYLINKQLQACQQTQLGFDTGIPKSNAHVKQHLPYPMLGLCHQRLPCIVTSR